VSVRRTTMIAAIALYVLLWVIAANGATGLVAPLAVPAVLALLVWLGLQLNRYLGLAPHRPKFDDGEDEPTT
jgi:hypothetical protein